MSLCSYPHSYDLNPQRGLKAAPGSVLDAFHRRRSKACFTASPLSERHMSQLLWAAYGICDACGGRTANASAGVYALHLYVLLADGIYHYEPTKEALIRVGEVDCRNLSGVEGAPVCIAVYADISAYPGCDDKAARHFAALDAGAVAANINLYCASEDLCVMEHAIFDDSNLSQYCVPAPSHAFQVALSVGYPE